MMNYQNKTKDELINELQKLQHESDSVKTSYEKEITERKRAEASLKQALEWQEAIFEGSRDSIFISDQDSRFVAVNNTACDLTGYSREQLLKMRIPDIHDLPDLDAYKMYHQRIFGGEEIFSEAKILRSDGAKIDTEFNNRCVSIAGKLYMHTTARNITERKQAETALLESEERFRTLYNDASTGLYRTNPKGEILLANRALVKMLGFQSFDELAAINLNRSGVGTTYQRQKFIDQIEKEGEVKDLEAIWICRDGKEIFVRENAKLIRDHEGKILYYDGTVEDITEKKKADQDLKSSLSILTASLESTAVGILMADGKGGIIKWNQKFAKMWGIPEKILDKYDDNVAINYILSQLINPDKFLAIVKDLYTNPEKLSFDKLEFKDGRIFERYSQPQKIDNKIVGRVWSFRDVTDRHKPEEALMLSEEKYRGIFENVQETVSLVSLK